mgnify:CR=1 FL=1
MKAVIILSLLALALPAQAQVYKCTEGGKTVYSQMPCGKEEKVLDIKRSVPRPGSYEAKLEDREEYIRNNPGISEVHQAAIRAGVAIPGMSAEHVIAAMGEPARKNLTQTLHGSRWQWVYGTDIRYTRYVYIEDDVVVATN